MILVSISSIFFSVYFNRFADAHITNKFFNAGRNNPSQLRSLDELLAWPAEHLEQVDIGLMNLICAQGLIGSEQLDIDQCLGILEEWAGMVKNETQMRMPAFYNNPDEYDGSEAVFRVVTLVLILKNSLGIHYNPEAANNWDFSDSGNIFIHGLLSEKRYGTCASIPVLCAAVGRRLGYPIKLAQAKGHMFFRWEDERERFNVESCCTGVDVRDDKYYRHWPEEISNDELKRNSYLKSLTPVEELAEFMGCRSSCLSDTGRLYEAQIASAWQCRIQPRKSTSLLHLLSLTDNLLNELARKEAKITGQTPGYAVPVYSEGQPKYYYTWRLPEKNPSSAKGVPEPIDVDQLTRRVDKMNAQRRRQMQDPLLPNTQPPMPGQRPMPKVIKKIKK